MRCRPRASARGDPRGLARPASGWCRRRCRRSRRPRRTSSRAVCVSTNAVRRSSSRPATRWSSPSAPSAAATTSRVAVRAEPVVEPAPAPGAAHRVGARAPGDREQPGAPARLGPEARQRPVGAEEHVLGHVVGVARPDEVGGEPPHVGLRPADGRGQRGAVPVPAGDQQARELVHVGDATGRTRPALVGPAEIRRRNARNPGTKPAPKNDYLTMDCDRCRTAISASLDGEEPGASDAAMRGPHRRRAPAAGGSRPARRSCTARPG